MVDIAVSDGLITRSQDISRANSQQVFDQSYPKLIELLYNPLPPRMTDININTIANRFSGRNANDMADDDRESDSN